MQEQKRVKLQVIAKGVPVQEKSQVPAGVTALGCGGAGACFAVPMDMD